MKAGDTVRCRYSDGYHNLTEGKRYAVEVYEAKFFDTSVPAGFSWPAYVRVTGDNGREVWAHASRFEMVEG